MVFIIKKGLKNENKPSAITQMRKESLVSSADIEKIVFILLSCLSSHTAARKVRSSPALALELGERFSYSKLFMSQILTNWDWTPFAIKTQMKDHHRSIEYSTKGKINVINCLWGRRYMIMLKISRNNIWNHWIIIILLSYQENLECRPKSYNKVIYKGTDTGNWKDLIHLTSNERRKQWKKISIQGNSDPDFEWREELHLVKVLTLSSWRL